MDKVLIDVKNLSLEIPIYDQAKRLINKSQLVNFSNRLIGSKKKRNKNKIFSKILDNINFKAYDSDTVGLLGHNGSGKTSLLRVIAGIYTPTSGSIEVNGRVNTIFNIASVFNLDATGYENIKIVQLYYYKDNTDLDFKSIDKEVEEYSDLGEFLNLPVKLYSSGMQARLIFSITMCLRSEITLIDEGIATGDEKFKKKASLMIKEYYSGFKLRIFASHDLGFIKENCNKILLLKKGEAQFFDDKEEGISYYISSLNEEV